MQKVKLTKRQRKCMRGASAAVQFSMRNGHEIHASDRTYVGAAAVRDESGRLLKHGVPFVRTS